MKRGFSLILLAFATAACLVSAPPKKATAAKSSKKPGAVSAKTVAHKTTRTTAGRTTSARAGTKSTSHSTANVRYVRNKHGKLVKVVSRSAPAPSYQLHPDQERYQQIQQALTDKGYFKGEVNGQWGDDSVDALKRFQADQKLDDDGHINSLTLIGLGLGPKHDHAVSVAAPANATAPAASSSAALFSNTAAKATSSTPLTPSASSLSTPPASSVSTAPASSVSTTPVAKPPGPASPPPDTAESH